MNVKPSISEEVRADIASLALSAGASFATRAAAIEQLEMHVIDRLRILQERVELLDELQALARDAAELHRRLEAANERMLERLRRRIRTGRYTPAGLKRAFTRYAGPASQNSYDALDVLIAGLLDAGALPEERVLLEPEMVAYQPTPARVILSLIDRAELRADDVLYDLGSGLGWVVILAALLTGARARGIELEPAYCEYARSCAAGLHVSRVELIEADAREASLADGTIYFLYTPFRGAMLQQVLERLRVQARQRPVRVCSYGPCTPEVAQANWLRPTSALELSEHEVAVFRTV